MEPPARAGERGDAHVMGLAVPHAAAGSSSTRRRRRVLSRQLDAPTLAARQGVRPASKGLVAAGATMLVDLVGPGRRSRCSSATCFVYEMVAGSTTPGSARRSTSSGRSSNSRTTSRPISSSTGRAATPARARPAASKRGGRRRTLTGPRGTPGRGPRGDRPAGPRRVYRGARLSVHAQRRFAQAQAPELTILMCGGGTSVPGLGELFPEELGMDAQQAAGKIPACVYVPAGACHACPPNSPRIPRSCRRSAWRCTWAGGGRAVGAESRGPRMMTVNFIRHGCSTNAARKAAQGLLASALGAYAAVLLIAMVVPHAPEDRGVAPPRPGSQAEAAESEARTQHLAIMRPHQQTATAARFPDRRRTPDWGMLLHRHDLRRQGHHRD